jgi:glucosylceramidase
LDVEVPTLLINLDEKFNTLILILLCHSCCKAVAKKELEVDVYETSAEGNLLKKIDSFSVKESSIIITLNPSQFQTIT